MMSEIKNSYRVESWIKRTLHKDFNFFFFNPLSINIGDLKSGAHENERPSAKITNIWTMGD